MVTCIGFLLIYMFDLTMHQFVRIFSVKRGRCVTQDSSIDSAHSSLANERNLIKLVDRSATNHDRSDSKNAHSHHLDYHIDSKGQSNQFDLVLNMHACNGTSKSALPTHRCESKQVKPKAIATIVANDYGSLSSQPIPSTSSTVTNETHSSDQIPLERDQKRILSLFNCLMIVGGLSMHAVFEGFAIGMQHEPLLLYQLSGAICLHKLLISFVLGLNLMCETGSFQDTSLGLLVFSAMTPLGLLVGAVWMGSVSVSSFPFSVPIANALATGTLFYVTFFELRPQLDHHSNSQSALHFLASLLGFLAVLATLLLSFDS
jgi:zinc transporter ZupT